MPAVRAAATSRAIAGSAASAPGQRSFPSGVHEVDLRVDVPENALHETSSSRAFGRRRRPTFADGWPSVTTMSRGEVVRAADQRRADAVGVDRHAVALELADLLDGEAAGDDDACTRSKPASSSASRTFRTSRGLTPVGREVAQLLPERAVDERLRRVEPHAPEPRPERVRDLERRAHRVVLEVDEHRHVHVGGRPVGEVLRRRDGVAAVRRDQRVRDRAEPAAAPPRRLLVGGDADSVRRRSGPATYAA